MKSFFRKMAISIFIVASMSSTMGIIVNADGSDPYGKDWPEYVLSLWCQDIGTYKRMDIPGIVTVQYGDKTMYLDEAGSSSERYQTLDSNFENGQEVTILDFPVKEGYELACSLPITIKRGQVGYDVAGAKNVEMLIPIKKIGTQIDIGNASFFCVLPNAEKIRYGYYSGVETNPTVGIYFNDQVPLTEGIDYTVEYQNENKDAENCLIIESITITGIGKYTGERSILYSYKDTVHKNKVIKNQKQATYKENGYSGDVYCDDCGAKLSDGQIIPKLVSSNNGGSSEKNANAGLVGEKIINIYTGLVYKITADSKNQKTVSLVECDDQFILYKAVIPDTVFYNNSVYKVTAIQPKAFKKQRELTHITIGKNVMMIGSQAFYGCSKLQKITVKTQHLTKKTVGKKAFYKAGSNNYKKLKVKIAQKYRKKYKNILRNAGLSKKAKIK